MPRTDRAIASQKATLLLVVVTVLTALMAGLFVYTVKVGGS